MGMTETKGSAMATIAMNQDADAKVLYHLRGSGPCTLAG